MPFAHDQGPPRVVFCRGDGRSQPDAYPDVRRQSLELEWAALSRDKTRNCALDSSPTGVHDEGLIVEVRQSPLETLGEVEDLFARSQTSSLHVVGSAIVDRPSAQPRNAQKHRRRLGVLRDSQARGQVRLAECFAHDGLSVRDAPCRHPGRTEFSVDGANACQADVNLAAAIRGDMEGGDVSG